MNEACPLLAAQPPSLEEALRRFEREAERGLFDTGRYRCAYYAWGTGPSLLFIHGLGDRARGYVPLVSILARDFRCIAYDLPAGRGDGARLGRYTHRDLVDDAVALLDHLGARQSYLFGTSFGSTVVLRALHAHPERFPRGVLSGGFAQRRLAPAEKLLASLGRCLPGSAALLPFRRLVGRQGFGAAACSRPDHFEFFLENTGQARLAAMARRALMIHETDLRADLAAIQQPVLIVCGEADPVVHRSCGEVLERGLSNARLVELSNCGHFAHYSHPEVLAEVVRGFLTPPSCPHG